MLCVSQKKQNISAKRTFRDQLFQILILEVRMCQRHSLFVTEAGQNPYILTTGAVWTFSDNLAWIVIPSGSILEPIIGQALCQVLKGITK